MQEGENVRRRGGGVARAIYPLAFIGALLVSTAAIPHASERPARLLAGCPGGAASGNRFFGIGGGASRRAGFHATAANPYALDGLCASDLLAGIDGGTFSAWFDWRHLGHPLYREDRFAAAFGVPCPFAAGIRLQAMPAIERREARGFPAEGSGSVSLGISRDCGDGACIGCVWLAAGGGEPGRRDARAFFVARAGPLALAADGAISGARGSDLQCALEAWIGDRWAFASSYRWRTGELSGGCIVRLSRAILDFSWSRSPALGGTVTAGAGRLWQW
jgi:hypothetical protein